MGRYPINRRSTGVMLWVVLFTSTSFADPKHSAPSLGLNAHGRITGLKPSVKDAKAAVARLYALYNKAEKLALSLQDKRKNDPAALPYPVIKKEYAEIWLGRRDARHLQLMGEPAYRDLQTKLRLIFNEYQGLARASLASPRVRAEKEKIINQLRAKTQQRNAMIEKQKQAIQRGDLEGAERVLEAEGKKLYEQIAFMIPSERGPFLFDDVIADMDEKLNAKRRTNYLAQSKQVMSKNLQLAKDFNTEAARLRDELAKSGTATVGEAKVNTAGAIEHLVRQWGTASAGLTRNCALRWAMSLSPVSDSGDYRAQALRPVRQLQTDAIAAINDLISAAANSTPPEQVRALYAEIVEQLTMIDRRSTGDDVSKACEASLAKLLALDPSMAAQISDYQRATSEALRWRMEFAAQQAKRLAQGFPNTETVIQKKAKIEKSNKPPMYRAVVTGADRILFPTNFGQPAAWMVYEAGEVIKGTRISGSDTVRVGSTSVLPFRSSHYSRVAVGLAIDAEVNALKKALLIDDTHPPLTLEAADAISSARLHEFYQVGGEVGDLQLEATVTRFIALPPVAYPLTPLGTLPTILDNSLPLDQTCWRFDILPHWVHHKYFTYAIPSMKQ